MKSVQQYLYSLNRICDHCCTCIILQTDQAGKSCVWLMYLGVSICCSRGKVKNESQKLVVGHQESDG